MPRIYDPFSNACDGEEKTMLALRRELIRLPPPLFGAAVSAACAPQLAPAPVPAGARVEARCKGSPLFYPGMVLHVDNRASSSSPSPLSSTTTRTAVAYTVQFDDGDVDEAVPRAHIHNLYPQPSVRAARQPVTQLQQLATTVASSAAAPPTSVADATAAERPVGTGVPGVGAQDDDGTAVALSTVAGSGEPGATGVGAAGRGTKRAPSMPEAAAPAAQEGAKGAARAAGAAAGGAEALPPLHNRVDLTTLPAAVLDDLRAIVAEHKRGAGTRFCVCRSATSWPERGLLVKCHGAGTVRGVERQPCSGRIHPECFGLEAYTLEGGDEGGSTGNGNGGNANGGGSSGMMLGGQPVDSFVCDLCANLAVGRTLDVILATNSHKKQGSQSKGVSCPFCSSGKGAGTAWVGPFLDAADGATLGWVHVACALAAAGAGCDAATGRWYNVAVALREARTVKCARGAACSLAPAGLPVGFGASVPCSHKGCTDRMHLPCVARRGAHSNSKPYCPSHASARPSHACVGSTSARNTAKRQKIAAAPTPTQQQ